jgi:putative oxidoreductase
MSTNVTTAGTRPRLATVGLWAVQVVLAVEFAAAGFMKVSSDPAMLEMFDQIGAGQWLRYLVGALELAAAAGLLIPRLAAPAALGLVALMTGAVLTNVAVLGAAPWVAAGFGLAAALVVRARRASLSAMIGRKR